jgi:uracil-DNA glycosylase family 4
MAEDKGAATHHDVMQELGLAPVWVRRTPAAGSSPSATPQSRDNHRFPAAVTSEREASLALAPSREALPPRGEDAVSADRAQRAVRISTLDFPALEADVAACVACPLCRTRNRTVPGVGDRQADWLFVGEAPGAEEDAKGEPFVGQAGRLLDNMLAALGMSRENNVYIANVLKCRPPGNRTPEPAEAAACRPYLERQVALLRPRLIVALGRSAAVQLLNVDAPIATLRGRVHRYGDIPLIVTYHPAYLLRNLPDKAKAWEDLLLARRTVAAGAPAD